MSTEKGAGYPAATAPGYPQPPPYSTAAAVPPSTPYPNQSTPYPSQTAQYPPQPAGTYPPQQLPAGGAPQTVYTSAPSVVIVESHGVACPYCHGTAHESGYPIANLVIVIILAIVFFPIGLLYLLCLEKHRICCNCRRPF